MQWAAPNENFYALLICVFKDCSPTKALSIMGVPHIDDAEAETRKQITKRPKIRFTKEELYKLYIEEGKSTNKISALSGYSHNSIYLQLKEYGIPIREKGMKADFKIVTKQEIEELYVNERLTLREIGKRFGMAQSTVYKLINEYEIKRRGLSEAMTNYFDKERIAI